MEAAVTLARTDYLDPALTGLYQPRQPQETLLYRLVQENLETFLARSREACPQAKTFGFEDGFARLDDDPIPPYVERTFRKCANIPLWNSVVVVVSG